MLLVVTYMVIYEFHLAELFPQIHRKPCLCECQSNT